MEIFAPFAAADGLRELRLPPAGGLRDFLASTAAKPLPVNQRCFFALRKAGAAAGLVFESRPSELLDMISTLIVDDPELDFASEAKFYPVCSFFVTKLLKRLDRIFNEEQLALTHQYDSARGDLSSESDSRSAKSRGEARPRATRPDVLVCMRQIAVLLAELKVKIEHIFRKFFY